MDDRRAELDRLAARLRDHDAVCDVWLAKSFTDRVLVLETTGDVPTAVRETLTDHDLRGANEVYDVEGGDDSSVGAVGETARHRFVDTRTRGEHQSYVVE